MRKSIFGKMIKISFGDKGIDKIIIYFVNPVFKLVQQKIYYNKSFNSVEFKFDT